MSYIEGATISTVLLPGHISGCEGFIDASSKLSWTLTVAAMANRFFPNDLPEFVEENQGVVAQSTLHNLLYLPYPKLADKLLKAALDLKDKVNFSSSSLVSCSIALIVHTPCLLVILLVSGGEGDLGPQRAAREGLHALYRRLRDGLSVVQVLSSHQQPKWSRPLQRDC